jgi:hypothetical protein
MDIQKPPSWILIIIVLFFVIMLALFIWRRRTPLVASPSPTPVVTVNGTSPIQQILGVTPAPGATPVVVSVASTGLKSMIMSQLPDTADFFNSAVYAQEDAIISQFTDEPDVNYVAFEKRNSDGTLAEVRCFKITGGQQVMKNGGYVQTAGQRKRTLLTKTCVVQ